MTLIRVDIVPAVGYRSIMTKMVLVACLLMTLVVGTPADAGMFNASAILDSAQVVQHPGVWLCPEGQEDNEQNCMVDYVQIIPDRPDWDHAMSECLHDYSAVECYRYVSDGGEF